jgi:3-hydroxyacyl-[acyl-carrier-protein] dehydratase
VIGRDLARALFDFLLRESVDRAVRRDVEIEERLLARLHETMEEDVRVERERSIEDERDGCLERPDDFVAPLPRIVERLCETLQQIGERFALEAKRMRDTAERDLARALPLLRVDRRECLLQSLSALLRNAFAAHSESLLLRSATSSKKLRARFMRYFLLDRVTDVVPGESARGIKNVTLTDEVLHDHFPDHPILPGALIVEGMAQLAGFLLEVTVNAPDKPVVRALLVQIQNAKFSRPAEPGDQIELVARQGAILDAAAQVDVEALVAGQRVARAQLTFMLKPIESERVHEQRRYLYRLWTKGLAKEIRLP